MAKTLPISDVEACLSKRLKETLEVLSDPDLMQQIKTSQAFYKAGKKGLSFEDVFGEPLLPQKRSRRR